MNSEQRCYTARVIMCCYPFDLCR